MNVVVAVLMVALANNKYRVRVSERLEIREFSENGSQASYFQYSNDRLVQAFGRRSLGTRETPLRRAYSVIAVRFGA